MPLALDDNDATRKVLIEGGNNNDYDDYTNPEIDDDDDDDSVDETSSFLYVINTILSGTARLNVLLPTATILAFTIFAPLLTNDGKCDNFNRWLMAVFLGISAASCVFFTFTDSFRTASGRLYYGIATINGIWTFNYGGRKRPCRPSDYKLRWADLFHASLSLIAFLTFAGSNYDVVLCYYPSMPRMVTNTVPLVVGFVISVLFVVFPSKRRGIGYPFLLRRDALYFRS
ncbi:protein DMP4-like [Telopea speciosissima]|uniref:protein DMP4-like n=1 Tax=Telopea speciosissima TaxID=54955 RepID=UPI001CC4EF75|nr:protein DMP4-like [Telopea speciosissima]